MSDLSQADQIATLAEYASLTHEVPAFARTSGASDGLLQGRSSPTLPRSSTRRSRMLTATIASFKARSARSWSCVNPP
ncbi:MAG UNVERIFIED_CONTAM: hypothetical protein LVT10_26015 [Anaerolineae bacterium]